MWPSTSASSRRRRRGGDPAEQRDQRKMRASIFMLSLPAGMPSARCGRCRTGAWWWRTRRLDRGLDERLGLAGRVVRADLLQRGQVLLERPAGDDPRPRSSSASGTCRTARRTGRRSCPSVVARELEAVVAQPAVLLSRAVRDDVALEQELRHPERVDDVVGVLDDLDGLAAGSTRTGISLASRPCSGTAASSRRRVVRSVLLGVARSRLPGRTLLGSVLELPVPLERVDLDEHVRVLRQVVRRRPRRRPCARTARR